MKNNSDEIIVEEKIQNGINFEQSKKNNIITEPLELRNNLSNSSFIKPISVFSLKIKIIMITLYFILIIGLEFFYRDYLFKKSIILQENIQRNPKNDLLLKISKIISFFGGEVSASFFLFFIFLFMPLNYSFLILQSIIYSCYFTNVMKMIYQSDRPNWRSNYLTYYCDYEYGNPSGHSFNSINMFLCLAHIFIQYFKIKKYLFKILIFIIFIFISFLIILSRIILAAHSINQVLYGALLGIGVYAILIHIIQYHKYSSIQFYQHIKKKRIKKIYYIFHIFLLIISILIYLFTENKDHTDINKTIFNGIRCDIKPYYKRYKNGGLFQALSIMGIIGAQFGVDILFILLKKNNYMINYSIIEWNKNYKIKNILLRLIISLISSIGIILYFIVPGNMNLVLVFIFKSTLAFFLGAYGIFSFGIYLCIKLKITNKDIYKMEALHEITAEV